MSADDHDSPLARRLSFPVLLLYGLGTMVGGGIYALVGEVAGVAGAYVPLAFVVSGGVAGLSAACFAELAARLPTSAGEARYVLEAFGRPALSRTVGVLVTLTGVVSAATLCVAFGRFLHDLTGVPGLAGTAGVVVALAAVAAWGVAESAAVAVAITVVEVGGLLVVLGLHRGALAELPWRWTELVPPATPSAWLPVFVGGFLSFYAYVGFEDLVNLAEEVRDVRRTLPRAILVAMVVTTALYVAVAVAIVLGADPARIAASESPLATLAGLEGPGHRVPLLLVSLLSGVNGALVQVVMGARVLYGMASQRLAPAWLATVHPVRRTPVRATVAVAAAVLGLALAFDLVVLARVTAGILLAVFALVDASMAVIVGRDGPDPHAPGVPAVVGVVGAVTCTALLAVQVGVAVTGWVPGAPG